MEAIKIKGREGLYVEAISIHEKYASRPGKVEDLTLAQFATCYSKCARKPKKIRFKNGASINDGVICEYFS